MNSNDPGGENSDSQLSRFAMHPQSSCPSREGAPTGECDPNPSTDVYCLFTNVYALRWFHCEFFSSSIDREIEMNERKFIKHVVMAYPGLRRLWASLNWLDPRDLDRTVTDVRCPRVYWTILRALMGRPPLMISPYYGDERIHLNRRRWKFRLLQRKQVSEGFASDFEDMPAELSVPLVVGTRCIAWLTPPNVVRCGFFPGIISGVDYEGNTYRIIFDEPSVGTLSVVDHEVASLDALMTYNRVDYFIKSRHWKYRSQHSYDESFLTSTSRTTQDEGSHSPSEKTGEDPILMPFRFAVTTEDRGAGNCDPQSGNVSDMNEHLLLDSGSDDDISNEQDSDDISGEMLDEGEDVNSMSAGQCKILPFAIYIRELFALKRALRMAKKTHEILMRVGIHDHKTKQGPNMVANVHVDASLADQMRKRYGDSIQVIYHSTKRLRLMKPDLIRYRNSLTQNAHLSGIKQAGEYAMDAIQEGSAAVSSALSTVQKWYPDVSSTNLHALINDQGTVALMKYLAAIIIYLQKYVRINSPTPDEPKLTEINLSGLKKIVAMAASNIADGQDKAYVYRHINALLYHINRDLKCDEKLPFVENTRCWQSNSEEHWN